MRWLFVTWCVAAHVWQVHSQSCNNQCSLYNGMCDQSSGTMQYDNPNNIAPNCYITYQGAYNAGGGLCYDPSYNQYAWNNCYSQFCNPLGGYVSNVNSWNAGCTCNAGYVDSGSNTHYTDINTNFRVNGATAGTDCLACNYALGYNGPMQILQMDAVYNGQWDVASSLCCPPFQSMNPTNYKQCVTFTPPNCVTQAGALQTSGAPGSTAGNVAGPVAYANQFGICSTCPAGSYVAGNVNYATQGNQCLLDGCHSGAGLSCQGKCTANGPSHTCQGRCVGAAPYWQNEQCVASCSAGYTPVSGICTLTAAHVCTGNTYFNRSNNNCTSCTGALNYACAVQQQQPYHYMRLNENSSTVTTGASGKSLLMDSGTAVATMSSNTFYGYDGIYGNCPLSQGAYGVPDPISGSAWSVGYPCSVSLQYIDTSFGNAFTLQLWLRVDTRYTPGQTNALFTLTSDFAFSQLSGAHQVFITGSTGQIGVAGLNTADGTVAAVYTNDNVDYNAAARNAWQHITVVLSPTSGFSIYVNGTCAGGQCGWTPLVCTSQGCASTSSAVIAQHGAAPGYWVMGQAYLGGIPMPPGQAALSTSSSFVTVGVVSEVAIYNKSLSHEQVLAQWAASPFSSTLTNCTATNQVLYTNTTTGITSCVLRCALVGGCSYYGLCYQGVAQSQYGCLNCVDTSAYTFTCGMCDPASNRYLSPTSLLCVPADQCDPGTIANSTTQTCQPNPCGSLAATANVNCMKCQNNANSTQYSCGYCATGYAGSQCTICDVGYTNVSGVCVPVYCPNANTGTLLSSSSSSTQTVGSTNTSIPSGGVPQNLGYLTVPANYLNGTLQISCSYVNSSAAANVVSVYVNQILLLTDTSNQPFVYSMNMISGVVPQQMLNVSAASATLNLTQFQCTLTLSYNLRAVTFQYKNFVTTLNYGTVTSGSTASISTYTVPSDYLPQYNAFIFYTTSVSSTSSTTGGFTLDAGLASPAHMQDPIVYSNGTSQTPAPITFSKLAAPLVPGASMPFTAFVGTGSGTAYNVQQTFTLEYVSQCQLPNPARTCYSSDPNMNLTTCKCMNGFYDPVFGLQSQWQNPGATCSAYCTIPNGNIQYNSSTLSYSCQCRSNFNDSSCATRTETACTAASCNNGLGFCSLTRINGTQCQCPTGIRPQPNTPNCGYFVDRCNGLLNPNPCGNGGDCVTTGNNTFTCNCSNTAYGGLLCDQPPTTAVCQPGQCNNGQCVEPTAGATACVCNEGWGGPTCTVKNDFCVPSSYNPSGNLCVNNGRCISNTTGYTCDCTGLNYTGSYCEKPINPCTAVGGSPCSHGNCTQTGANLYSCDCAGTPYYGATCSMPIDMCTVNAHNANKPCLNGANCTNTQPGQYSCSCQPGYNGTNCQNLIDYCSPNPCNSQSCVSHLTNSSGTFPLSPAGYVCGCNTTYTGTNCTVLADKCYGPPSPTPYYCLNGGVCTTTVSGPVCNCANTGHNGSYCQTLLPGATTMAATTMLGTTHILTTTTAAATTTSYHPTTNTVTTTGAITTTHPVSTTVAPTTTTATTTPPTANVTLAMSLYLNYAALTPQSTPTFISQFQADVAAALGISSTQVVVNSLVSGSIIVNFTLIGAPTTSVSTLQTQIDTTGSMLLQGKVTYAAKFLILYSSSSGLVTAAPSSISSSSSSNNIPVIVGSVVGGMVGIPLLVYVFRRYVATMHYTLVKNK